MPQGPLTAIATGYAYANFSQNATAIIKPSGGIFHGFSVNTAGNGSTMLLVDGGPVGNVIGTFDTSVIRSHVFDLKFNTSLWVQLLGLEAADVTIMYM